MGEFDPGKPGSRPDLTRALRHGADAPAGERLGVPRNQVLRSTTPEPPPPPRPAPLRMDTVRLSTEEGVQREVLMPRGAVRWKMLESVVAELARQRGTTETAASGGVDDPLPRPPGPLPPPLVHIAGARPEQPVPHRSPAAAEGDRVTAAAKPTPPPPAQAPARDLGRILGGVFVAALGLAAVLILWVLLDLWTVR